MANTWSTQLSEDARRPACSRRFALTTGSTSGPPIQTQPTWSPQGKGSVCKTQITLHIWLLPQHELPLPLSPALCIFFQRAILRHHKCFGGNRRVALIPFPKITSARGKGQGGGACGPFCKSFKYPGTHLLKRIMKGKQPSFSISH